MKFIDFQESIDRSGILLIKMFYLSSKSNSDAIFVFLGVDLYNRILISSQNSNLEISASSTARPKLWRPCGIVLEGLALSNFTGGLPRGTHSGVRTTKENGDHFGIWALPTLHTRRNDL